MFATYQAAIKALAAEHGVAINDSDIKLSMYAVPYIKIDNKLFIVAIHYGQWEYTAKFVNSNPHWKAI